MRISDKDLDCLRETASSAEHSGKVATRARIVLWHSEGYSRVAIARMAGCSLPTVDLWVRRYAEEGLDGLAGRVSTGGPRRVSGSVRAQILALTRKGPPEGSGLSHWSSREMADFLKRKKNIQVSHAFIAKLWRDNGLKPHRTGSFKVPSDPEFAAKVADIVGLYLDPPDGAIVLSLDEKTQIQALDRTQPVLPIGFGKTEKRTHDYIRHGTTNLFGALNVLTGQMLGRCFARRRTREFLTFMDGVVAAYPADPIHVILDSLSTHNNDEVHTWLAKHSRVTFHFTPVGSSWLNMIENWFSILERQSVHRGTFTSVRHLIATITSYIQHWNEKATPFEWTATAEDIIEKVAILDRDFRRLVANNA